MTPSDTPRTDAAHLPFTRKWWTTDEQAVHADFARQLERENNAMRKALQYLYDEQNDAPLEKHRATWEAAMKQAADALKESQP